MKAINALLTDLFRESIQKTFPEFKDLPIEISKSTQEKFGHYQLNNAMKMAKQLKTSPRDVAAAILQNLPDSDLIQTCEIAGPGFINVTLSKEYLAERLNKMYRDDHFDMDTPPTRKKIIIDFSSPNTAKEMHVGHLRSTIIGDCLARLFEFLGYDVLRLNHIGDWGTAFGMLLAYIKRNAPSVLQGTEEAKLGQLVTWYKASKQLFDQDPEFKKASQLEVVALQSGEPAAKRGWDILCAISRKAYQEIYDLLEIRIIERGESFYNPMLPQIVADLENKNLITISDGAKCLFVEGFKNREGDPLPLMIQKSDGGFNYDTTDMAAIYHRIHVEHADRIIYVTDIGQSTHFQMIFKAAEKASYLNSQKTRVDHVGFGLVLGSDGKKLKTRSGETERLMDLLTAGIDYANKLLNERNPNMAPEERTILAKALGLGAIKYADLSSHRTSDYQFSYEKMLRFEGNTAAFIMYSYVRVGGIKRKIGVEPQELLKDCKIVLGHPSEISLGLTLAQFPEALQQVAEELLPNRLTDYLYELAEKFNAFFRDCRVEGASEQNSRLLLCDLVAKILKQGLEILGIHPVEKM
ncbi:Arginine--tRNA ligase [Chlamydiales bacterium STE3]|nr:Arginine--tRNA ligase [Chlamydiales bacterium STE3]